MDEPRLGTILVVAGDELQREAAGHSDDALGLRTIVRMSDGPDPERSAC